MNDHINRIFPSFLALASATLLWPSALALAAEVPPPITRIGDVRALPRERAAEGRSVTLRGVITFTSKSAGSFVMQDEREGAYAGDGIYVSPENSPTSKRHDVEWVGLKTPEVGMLVEVRGLTMPGGYAPVIAMQRVTYLGTAPLPEAREASLTMLLNGVYNCQRVTLRGVVQRMHLVNDPSSQLRMNVAGWEGVFMANVLHPGALAHQQLEDADVQITGVSMAYFNSRGELNAIHLECLDEKGVQVIRPAPPDPFAVPEAAALALQPFRQELIGLHRQRFSGVVTFARPGKFLYVQSKERSFRVNTSAAEKIASGDVVDVSGFVTSNQNFAAMNAALVRKTGHAALPKPIAITKSDIIKPQLFAPWILRIEDYDGAYVSLRGVLVKIEMLEKKDARLYLDCEGTIIIAELGPGVPAAALAHLLPGSEVEVAGICSAQLKNPWPIYAQPAPETFSLYLQGAESIKVLRAPSKWTRERILGLASVLAALVAIVSGWVLMLQRTVRRQAARIEGSLRSHRDTELEFQAAQRERHHLAADLHDGLQQTITGASYRLEAALRRLGPVSTEADEQFAATRAAIERTRTGLRECLVGLRQVEEGPAEFAALLRSALKKMEHWPEGAVEIETSGDIFRLSRHVMGSLLLLTQEAVGNAFRHGAATHVRVTLRYLPASFEMSIEDNGAGFDPQRAPGTATGHFGLESMRHRLLWLGGNTEIDSAPGRGTRIIARLAREKAIPSMTQPMEQEDPAP